MDALLVVINIIAFLLLIGALVFLKRRNVKFSHRVMIGSYSACSSVPDFS